MNRICSYVVLIAYSTACFSHGGGLNADGCHQETETGGYHCHNESGSKDESSRGSRNGIAFLIGAVLVLWIVRNTTSYNYNDETQQSDWYLTIVTPNLESGDLAVEISYEF